MREALTINRDQRLSRRCINKMHKTKTKPGTFEGGHPILTNVESCQGPARRGRLLPHLRSSGYNTGPPLVVEGGCCHTSRRWGDSDRLCGRRSGRLPSGLAACAGCACSRLYSCSRLRGVLWRLFQGFSLFGRPSALAARAGCACAGGGSRGGVGGCACAGSAASFFLRGSPAFDVAPDRLFSSRLFCPGGCSLCGRRRALPERCGRRSRRLPSGLAAGAGCACSRLCSCSRL